MNSLPKRARVKIKLVTSLSEDKFKHSINKNDEKRPCWKQQVLQGRCVMINAAFIKLLRKLGDFNAWRSLPTLAAIIAPTVVHMK